MIKDAAQGHRGRRRIRACFAVAVVVSIVGAACGSSQDGGALDAGPKPSPGSAPAGEERLDVGPGGSDAGSGVENPGAEGASGITPEAGGVRGASPTSRPGPTLEPQRKPVPEPGRVSPASSKATGSKEPGSQASGSAAEPPSAPAAATGAAEKAEIVIGSFGTQSGVIGTASLPIHQAARAWVKEVNERGGLAGHKVRLVMADDGGDPAKALSLVRRMVEENRIQAIYAEHGPTTVQAVLPYLEERQIPSIGPCFCAPANAKSPMAFHVGIGSDYGISWSHILPILSYTDKRKVSLFFCREAPTCRNMRNRIREVGPRVKLEVVHEAEVSLAQPDYTAEVLAARNAGTEIIITLLENASVVRIARSAHRQGWFPLISTQGASSDERFLKDGGEDVEGVLIGGYGPYWESPKLKDYNSALDQYVPGAVKSSLGVMAWSAGKLLEAIAPALPAVPTSADILARLYALNGETLGGLSTPLFYRPGEGSDKINSCIVPLSVKKGKFVPKNGDNFICPP